MTSGFDIVYRNVKGNYVAMIISNRETSYLPLSLAFRVLQKQVRETLEVPF